MRCRFLDDENPSERAARQALLGDVGALYRALESDGARTGAACRRIDPGLDCRAVELDGAERLAIECLDPELRPLRELILQGAPASLRERVLAGVPPQPLTAALARVEREYGLKLERASARAGFVRGHLLEVTLFSAETPRMDAQEATAACELLLSDLLGERTFQDWVGQVHTAPGRKPGALRVMNTDEPETFPLSELRPTVERAIEAVRAGLSEKPLWLGQSDAWTLFETEPTDDRSAQGDLVLASTTVPELLKSFLEGSVFSSTRFSRAEERFCYLKFGGAGTGAGGVSSQARLRERDRVEALVDGRLRNAGLGAVVGNGLGVEFSYVDLSLCDVERAARELTELVRNAEIGPNAWLLFCDTEWRREWIRLHPEAPPPP
jgi:hypothetical protein